MGTLLLISKKKEDHELATLVANATQLKLTHAQDAKQGVDILKNEGVVCTLVDATTLEDYQAFETAVQESVGLFSDMINANSIFFISSEEISQLGSMIYSPIFGNFITRDAMNLKEAGVHFGRLVSMLVERKSYSLQDFFPSGTKIQTVAIQKSNHKQNAVEAVKNFLLAAKYTSRMATVVANAVDELLMNAIFDAPVDEAGNHIYELTPRNQMIVLEGRSIVNMSIAFDGAYCGIQVTDLFGSLDKVKLFSSIQKSYVEEEYKVKMSRAGAGIGLGHVFRSGGSLLFVTEAQVKTDVFVFFKQLGNYKEFRNQFRFLATQFFF